VTSLEIRYRRLMRIYPAGHRAAYEEEMIGVLMSGAEPGRGFPSPADAIDLVRAGLTARFGQAFHTQRGTGWRDAAGATALFAALLMAGAAINRLIAGLTLWAEGDPLRLHGVEGLMLLDPALRAVIWPLVVVAAVLGMRRVTVGLSAAAVLVQCVGVGLWSVPLHQRGLSLVWGVVTAIAVTALFAVAASGRWIRPVLGSRGLALAVGGAAAAAVARADALDGVWFGAFFDDLPFQLAEVVANWVPALLLGAAAWTTGRRVRGRIAVLSTTVLATVYVFQDVPSLSFIVIEGGADAGWAVSRFVVLLLAPLVVLAGGLLVLAVRERLTGRGHGHVRAHE
jgi:uncharacterized integral membrane protein